MQQIKDVRAPAKASRRALRVQAVAAAAPPKPKTETPTPAELGYTMPGPTRHSDRYSIVSRGPKALSAVASVSAFVQHAAALLRGIAPCDNTLCCVLRTGRSGTQFHPCEPISCVPWCS